MISEFAISLFRYCSQQNHPGVSVVGVFTFAGFEIQSALELERNLALVAGRAVGLAAR